MRVLITGAAGFIGSHLARRHVERGDEVHALVRPSTDLERLSDIAGRVTLHAADLLDARMLDACLAASRPDVVYHLAVRTRRAASRDLSDAIQSVEQDLLGLLALLAAAQAATAAPHAFIRLASLAEYGDGPAPYRESQRERPLNAYSAALASGTHFAEMLSTRLRFPVINARSALAYGPGQSSDFIVPRLIGNCLARKATHIRRPNDRRDLIFVADLVDALLMLCDMPAPPSATVNIATGIAPTIREVAGIIAGATGASPSLITCHDGEAAGGVKDLRASFEALGRLTGWHPKTTLDDGIASTIAWYRSDLTLEAASP